MWLMVSWMSPPTCALGAIWRWAYGVAGGAAEGAVPELLMPAFPTVTASRAGSAALLHPANTLDPDSSSRAVPEVGQLDP